MEELKDRLRNSRKKKDVRPFGSHDSCLGDRLRNGRRH